MSSWFGLLRKDYQISKKWFFAWLLFLLVLFLSSFVLDHFMEASVSTFTTLLLLFLSQFAYMAVMMAQFLQVEAKKAQLWLHNPSSGKKLLGSKLFLSAFYQIVSLAVTNVFGWIVLEEPELQKINEIITWKDVLILNFSTFYVGFHFSCLYMFSWTLYHSFMKNPFMRAIRWLLSLSMVIVCMLLEFMILIVFEHFGFIKPFNIEFIYSHNQWSMTLPPFEVPVVSVIMYFLIGVALFFYSSLLLDKKVEV